MADFWDVLSFCNVFDLGFTRVPWTFDNKQKGDKNVKVRLDRVVASASWSSRFDHVPVLLELCQDESSFKQSRIARHEIALLGMRLCGREMRLCQRKFGWLGQQ
jgi:hypothetical protein